MSYRFRSGDPCSELVSIIHQVRRRWRMKLALRGALAVLGFGVVALVLTAWGLESWRFTAATIVAGRVVLAVALLALMAYFLVRPLLRRVSDEQVALYLEEREPSLQAAIVSAVETGGAAGASGSPYSSALVRRLVESAIDRCHAIDGGRRLERVPMRRYAIATGAIALATVALFTLGPSYLRHALSALFVVSRSVEAAAPYRIDVTPGNATVPKGADQQITAQLSGFDSEQAALMVRKSPDQPFERLPLLRASEQQGGAAAYEGMLFDLAGPVEYFVEAAGVRSPVFTLKVIELPYVQRLELEYHFPAYTGLPPQKVEDGGDIAVLRGTEIRVRAFPTMSARAGQVVLSDKTAAPLSAAADGAMAGTFKVASDGFYQIELDAATGEHVTASPKYTIDVLADQPPTVTIARPGRDTSASPIEEVFVEARAEDDFGVRDLDLVYSVNGGPEQKIRLFDGKNRLPEVSAGHTFYLEELNVKPGDFVSYYARAVDNDGVQGPKPALSDMYFVRVRPLSKDFRRAQSDAMGGGGGGGGGQGNEVGALSEQQRQIIAATFNVQRDRKSMGADKLRENTVVIGLSQARLREQVEGLVTRMNSRLVEQDPAFKKVAELLPKAVTEMKAAELKLQAVSPDGALPPEQKALQLLQQAEEEYEMQVSIQRQQGGGGGGGGGTMAQDLADLFEMELDKMANQYETRQQASQQQADQKIDELMEKLKELARRQEQEAERQRRRAALGQQLASGGGNQQRALAEQAEEAARRLEQLAREENRADLMESARRMQEAADAMRRAAANGQQAGAQAAAALERLREAERRLQQNRSGRAERDVREAQRRAQELANEQRGIADDLRRLDSTTGERRADAAAGLAERKNSLDQKVGDLEKQIDRAASAIRRDEQEAARRMSEAAGSIRDNRMRDAIRYSGAMVRQGYPASETQKMEDRVAAGFEALQEKLRQAESALGRGRADPTDEARDRARRLARGMESLEERTRERLQGQQGQQGQQGDARRPGLQAGRDQQGQQGDARRPGLQAGRDQEGQQGQQGQGGQQGSRDQQGQQGGQGGRNDGARTQDGRGGDGATFGNFRDQWGGGGDRRPGRLMPEDIRQFRSEVRQWTSEAQQLRRFVQGQPIDSKALDEILRGLRALDDDRVYKDVEELQRLQSAVAEGLKRFEYNLRRRAELKGNEVFVSGAEDVPEEFRKLVEQYYKSLSKNPKDPK